MNDAAQTPSDSDAAHPPMELLEGDAVSVPPASPSWILKLVRGAVYGILLVAATGLLAVSAVPELASYVTLGSAGDGQTCSMSGCTVLDQQSVAATAGDQDSSKASCCSTAKSTLLDEVINVSAETPSGCCPSHGAASLTAATAGDAACTVAASSCCEKSDACSSCQSVAASDAPIDAGSLIAAAASDQSSDQQSDEDRDVLQPDQDEVKE